MAPSNDTTKKPALRLVGTDGNAFAILAKAHRALKFTGRAADIGRFDAEAMSGDYDHLLATCMRWFDVS